MDITTILKQRDRASFDWLYSQYAPMLFGIILRMVEDETTAQNLLRETFVDAWRSLHQFDETKGSVFTWMIRIARRKAAEYTGPTYQMEPAGIKKNLVSNGATDRTERIFQLLKNGRQHEYSGIY